MEDKTIESWEIITSSGSEETGIRVSSIDKEQEYLCIPERIEGLPVWEIGPYALEQGAVREIRLPSFLKRIGRYAFYNCENLEKISLREGLTDVGSGAFTGVHRVKQICLTMEAEGEKQAVLQELLADFSETIEVILLYPGQEVHILFPEYYEQGVENTPARIIVNQFFGTGMKYRNCFVNRQLQLEEYDGLFPLAAAGEKPETVRELAIMRLMYPYRLKKEGRKNYLDWIRDHADEVLDSLIREKRLEEIRLLLQESELSSEVKRKAALLCAETGFAEAVSLFMEADSMADRKEAGGGSEQNSSRELMGNLPGIKSSFDLDEL